MTGNEAESIHPALIQSIVARRRDIFALQAAMDLDLFTPLRDGPLSAEQLAKTIGADSNKLRLLLYVLASIGLLTVKDGQFANSPEAQHFLVRGQPTHIGEIPRLAGENFEALLKTAKSVRTGQAQAKIDYAAISEKQVNFVIRGLQPGAMAAGRSLAAAYDFSKHRTLLDAAGGSGGLALALTQAFPHLRATVVDLPGVTPVTQGIINEAGASGRIQVQTGDLLAGPLMGIYDVAVMRCIIQVLSPQDAGRALANVAAAMHHGGAIYILGTVLEDSRLAPKESVMSNLFFLNVYDGGQAYTETEYRGWLTDAGFENVRVDWNRLSGGSSVIIARRA